MDLSEIQDLLDCSVCSLPLNNISKVLPCQHTFCRRCLNKIVRTKGCLQCPECRSVFQKTSVDSLPSNVFLERLASQLNKTDRPAVREPIMWKWQGIQEYQKQPTAKALYDFTGTEDGVLSFCKGDVMLLSDHVDENWYEAVLDGKRGIIPANYVKVTVPFPTADELSSQEPCAKAMYNFEKRDEVDLLVFKKGDIIKVLKTVDENWCEGILGNQQGIFPLNFVELNVAAENLILTSESSDEEYDAPEQKDTAAAISSEASNRMQGPAPKRHTIHVDNPDELRNVQSNRCLDYSVKSSRNRDRRASETSVQETVSKLASLKTSSPSSDDLIETVTPSASTKGAASAESAESKRSSSPRASSTESSDNLYVCLFSFKPQKSDEMALLRGEVYCVSYKFRDGWFKGSHVGSEKSGVFPGNYVTERSNHPPQLFRSLSSNQATQLPAGHLPARLTSLQTSAPCHMHSASAPALLTQLNQRRSHISPSQSAGSVRRGRTRTGSEPIDPSLVRQKAKPKSVMGGFFRKLKKKPTAMPAPALPGYHLVPNVPWRVFWGSVPILPSEPPPPYSPPLTQLQPPRSPVTTTQAAITQNGWWYRAVTGFPCQHEHEIALTVGDVLLVTKKRDDGWYYGKSQRTGKTGLFPSSFVESI